jgi:signal transduction histidine kinase
MIKLEPVAAAALLSMAARQAAPLIDEAGMQLELEYDNDIPPVQVDTHRITQVFWNLLDNALRAWACRSAARSSRRTASPP